MSSSPLVSVIIIFLNAERFIEEAIKSVFAQTYTIWELFLVDDGSSDGSTTIARTCAEQHPEKVRYLEHPGRPNRGMSAARNLGIHHSNGDYIAFLDADDVWLPHKLEQQVAILETQPEAAMVYNATQWWYSWTVGSKDSQPDFVHKLGVPPNALLQPPLLLTSFLRMEGVSPCPSSVLLRRDVIERVNGFEESFRGMYEDQVFFAKVCLAAPIFASDDCSSRYRQHSNSETSLAQKKDQHAAARYMFLKWLEWYLSQGGAEDVQVWQALRKELFPYRFPRLYRFIISSLSMARWLYRFPMQQRGNGDKAASATSE